MSPELVQAISRTQKLFEERKRPSDWGINIIEGSTGLESKEDWSKYYMYLTNPDGFNPEITPETITGEEIIEAPPPEFDVIKHQNGCETIIHYKLKSVDEEKDFEDEKIEE